MANGDAEGYIFCKIVAGEIPSNKVHEDDDIVAFSLVLAGARGRRRDGGGPCLPPGPRLRVDGDEAAGRGGRGGADPMSRRPSDVPNLK